MYLSYPFNAHADVFIGAIGVKLGPSLSLYLCTHQKT